MHQAYFPLPRCTLTNNETVWGCSKSGFSSHGPLVSYNSCIRHLGAVWAWPNLQGCTGAMLGVTDIGTDTGVTLGTADVCGLGVTGIAGATDRGCGSCAGLVGAGVVVEMQGVAGACDVADVISEVVSVGLTLHSQRCHLMQQ